MYLVRVLWVRVKTYQIKKRHPPLFLPVRFPLKLETTSQDRAGPGPDNDDATTKRGS